MQLLNLQVPLHLVAAVKGVGDVGDQLPVFGLGGEIAATALDQLLLQPVFPVPVGALDRAVLVGVSGDREN
jgi:methylaspartate ammonia-lyase